MRVLFTLAALVIAAALSACAYTPKPAVMSTLPVYPTKTPSQAMLNDLPAPEHPVAVAVYGFSDQTGQFKLTTTGQTLSRAISQGGGSILMHSLQEAGNRSWFTVVEREQLKDVLNERQLIRDMRAQYLGEKGVNPQALPALLFAGVLLEGGVVGYDTNTVTGGVGATLLGIGGDAKYQQDTVTVYLRATSVKTGEVLTSITASKTITSYAVDANVFRYIGSTTLLETENGFTTNEPGLVALQAAIDKAVYGLILEGVDLKLWNFADPTAGAEFVDRYHQERSGMLSPQQVAALERRAHGGRATTPRPVILPAPDAGPQARNAGGPRTATPASATTSAAAPSTTPKTGWGRPIPWTTGPVKPDAAAAGASFAPPPAMSSTSRSDADPIGDLIAELNSPQSAPRSGGAQAQFAPS